MKIGVIRLVPRDLLWGAVFVYAYGALLGSLWLGWLLVTAKPAPRLDVLGWVLAPFAVGAMALALEAVGEFLFNGFGVRPSESRFRKRLGGAALFILMLLLVIGWPIFQMSRL